MLLHLLDGYHAHTEVYKGEDFTKYLKTIPTMKMNKKVTETFSDLVRGVLKNAANSLKEKADKPSKQSHWNTRYFAE